MNTELAVEIAHRYIEVFRRATSFRHWPTGSSYTLGHLSSLDEGSLFQVMARLAADLDGADWAEIDPGFIPACLEAGIDYDNLLTMPTPDRPGQAQDLERKELGDLGELMCLMSTLAHENRDPALVMAKNALKLYQKISEPGIDVVALELDTSATDRSLAAGEKLHLTEVKTSVRNGFHALAGEAAASIRAVDLIRIQRELRLVRASLADRGLPAAAARVPLFLLEYRRHSTAIEWHAFLPSESTAPTPFDNEDLDETSDQVVLCEASLGRLRSATFAYRHR